MSTACPRLVRAGALLPALALLSAVLLGACASGDDRPATAGGTDSATGTLSATTATTSAPPSDSPTSSPTSDATRLSVTVRDGDVRPAPHRVKLDTGDEVELRVTADVSDEVHVHGVDKSKEIKPGRPVVLRFVVDQPGVFEVELEHEGLQLLQLEVR